VKKFLPLYILPVVIGAYSLVHAVYCAKGVEHYSVSELMIAAILTGGYSVTVLLLMSRKNNPVSLLIASLILIITLFYGLFRDLLFLNPMMNVFVKNYFANRHNLLFILLISLLLSGLVKYLISRPAQSILVAKFLLVFFTLLICMDIVMFYQDQPPMYVSPPSQSVTDLRGAKPDIYFLIFDSETSSKSLKTYWHYTPDSVEKKLTEKGFFIPANSRSNYNWTAYSIASTLNMSYFPDHSATSTDEEFPQSIYSEVINIFGHSGYSVYNLSFLSFIDYPRLHSFMRYNIWKKTLFYFFYDRVTNYSYVEYAATQRELLNVTYDSLSSLIGEKTSRPKFVYAHFYVPHTPAFVDENGKEHNARSMDAQDMAGYLAQVAYSRTMMLDIVEKIQQASGGKAIIIIQGDHGYRFLEGAEKMNEQFSVFKAVYFPDKNYSLFNDSTSSVNTFRVVLNSQFGMNMPLLKDSSFNVLVNVLATLR
jgi:hypothetical protein